jgi:transposase
MAVKLNIGVNHVPMPLSKSTRETIIYHKNSGAKNSDIAKWLRITTRSVERISKLYREQNSIEPKPHNKGRKPAFEQDVMDKITSKITEQPDITLEELIEEFELKISKSALSRKLTKIDLTFKKRLYMQKNNNARMYKNYGKSG